LWALEFNLEPLAADADQVECTIKDKADRGFRTDWSYYESVAALANQI
jgi:hypothetical protein